MTLSPSRRPRSSAARRRRAVATERRTEPSVGTGLIGIPFDANSSYLRGPARAPAAIRASMGSAAGNPYSERGVRVWPGGPVVDHGNLRIPARSGVRGPIDTIERGVAHALATTSRLVCLGGDHAITYPVVRAMAERWGRISILHIDAHPDMYPDFEGNRYSHASPMARILEDGLVDRLVQIGIRSVSPEQDVVAARFGVEVWPAHACGRLPRFRFATPLYVSIDIDGIDPAYAPGVSHPEPGGLSVRQVIDLLEAVQAPARIGGDIVELNPRRDPSGLTTAVAAKLARELLAHLISETSTRADSPQQHHGSR